MQITTKELKTYLNELLTNYDNNALTLKDLKDSITLENLEQDIKITLNK